MNGDLITVACFLKGSPIYDVPCVLPGAIPPGLRSCQIFLDKQGPAAWPCREPGRTGTQVPEVERGAKVGSCLS
jgi:hypothetical protein